ncbi:MAG: GGDEF domain-containing protein [Zoogloeaceae bacterium]|nr:GGDEF domain-containing protein [Zoogloeaceae bacterium]
MRRRFATLASKELLLEGWRQLLTPFHHQPLVSARRASMVVNRIQLLAFLFAILTLCWSLVDFLLFPPALGLYLFGLHILTSVAFLALATLYKPRGRLVDIYCALAIWCAIPITFYLASHIALSSFQAETEIVNIMTGYSFLPFVLLSSLTLFPLTIMECLCFALPIMFAQEFLGVVNWIYTPQIHVLFFSNELWLLAILTVFSTFASISQLALMLALIRQAARDPLTGAFARRSGEELLRLQYNISLRNQTPLSLAFIDLDHFKNINDRFGHERGDLVLKNATENFLRQLRAGDILTRWGGEEFLLIMPNTSLRQAHTAIRRFYATGLGHRPDGQRLTASIGIAERREDAANSGLHLIDIADARMYRAKQQGRDRIIAQDAPHEEPEGSSGVPRSRNLNA